MKVIVASYWKTGTKTIKTALRELGYNVYDNLEHYLFHYDEWIKILGGKGSVEDFKRMYADVDAVTDFPACLFWKEIHEAFPEAKIVMTTRDEESWYKSLKTQCEVLNQDSFKYASVFTSPFLPFVRRLLPLRNYWNIYANGRPMKIAFPSYVHVPDPLIAKQFFRKHVACVLQEAPKDKLLMYDVKQGWQPLCRFLGKNIPKTTFPWVNVGGKDYLPEDYKHLFARLVLKELLILFVAVFAVLFAVYFFLKGYSYFQSILTFLFGFLFWFCFLGID